MRLNCDMGEIDIAVDQQLMPYIHMANIACGFHASDPEMMQQTVVLARSHGVAIGAHPGYPDRENFGRQLIPMTQAQLAASLQYQIGALQGICQGQAVAVEYVKPHGALYNAMLTDLDIMQGVLNAMGGLGQSLPLMVMAVTDDHPLRKTAHNCGIQLIMEAFCDRVYNADGTLVPRSQPGAVLVDIDAIASQIEQLVLHHRVQTIDGSYISIAADTLCIHGDSPLAFESVKIARQYLDDR